MKPSHRNIVLNQKQELPFTFNIKKGLQNWRNSYSSIKNGSNEIINIAGLGDSILTGQLAGNTSGADYASYIVNGVLGKLRDHFNTVYDDGGRGFIPNSHYPGVWDKLGSWFTAIGYGICNSCWASTTNGSTMTLAFNGTGITVYGLRMNGLSTFTITVDGGTPQPFTEYNSTEQTAYPFTVSGLEDGDHTAVITVTGGALYVFGAMEIKGNKGVRVHTNSRGGSKSADGAVSKSLDMEINAVSPVLTIINHCANDYSNQISLDSYKSNMQSIITRAKSYGDVLILLTPLNNSLTIKSTSYQNTLYDLAKENACAVVDFVKKWGGNVNIARTNGFMHADLTHPLQLGHDDMSNTIMSVLESP
jgi:hypothetical protein